MAAISTQPIFQCVMTADGGGLTWLPNKQVTLTLKNGNILSVDQDGSVSQCPAGSTGPHERAWPLPANANPPDALAYFPDQDEHGASKLAGWVFAYQP